MPENLGIVVITHNGLPPAEGGKRLGYSFKNMSGQQMFVWAGTSQIVPYPFGIKGKPKPKVIYRDLPRVNSWDECIACEARTNFVEVKTDLGIKDLRKCIRCGKLHRMRQDLL